MIRNAFGSLAAAATMGLMMLSGCSPDLSAQDPTVNGEDAIARIIDRIPHHAAAPHIMPVIKPGDAPITTAAADLQYYGGKVVSNIKVIPVLWGAGVNTTVATGLQGFYQAAVTGPYWDWLTEYNTAGVPPVGGGTGSNQTIGHGSAQAPVMITPSVAGMALQDADIKNEIAAQIRAGHLPPADDNTYYPVFFPPHYTISLNGSGSCQVFCAYHGTVAASAGVAEFYYGVEPDFGPGSGCDTGCGTNPTMFNNVTSVASHELVETTTDAEVGLSTVIGKPLAWYDSTNGEIGDICNGQQGSLPGTSYTVQKEWSNRNGACIVTSGGTGGAVSAAITAPANGATLSGSVMVTATAATTFTGATISSVAFYYGTTLIGTANASPYRVTWDTTRVANGPYSLTAKATDSGGHTGTSAAVAVTVSNGGTCANVNDPGTGNETLATAFPLPGSCANVTGQLKTSSDIDYFKVSLAANHTFAVTKTDPGGSLYYLLAFDQNGAFIGFGLNQINVTNHGTSASNRFVAVLPLFGAASGKNYTLKASW